MSRSGPSPPVLFVTLALYYITHFTFSRAVLRLTVSPFKPGPSTRSRRANSPYWSHPRTAGLGVVQGPHLPYVRVHGQPSRRSAANLEFGTLQLGPTETSPSSPLFYKILNKYISYYIRSTKIKTLILTPRSFKKNEHGIPPNYCRNNGKVAEQSRGKN